MTAKLSLEIEAAGDRTALTELLNDLSAAVDAHPDVKLKFSQRIENNTLVAEPVVEPSQAVALADLLDDDSSPRARKAVTVLEKYSGIKRVNQVLAMTEEELLACHYFGDIIMPDFVALLAQAGYTWPDGE